MPAVALEHAESRQAAQGEQPGLTLRYVVSGAADYDEALAALEAEAPGSVGALVCRTLSVKPEGDGSSFWSGSAEYGAASAASYETGESSFEFDTTGGGGVHLTQALEHLADYAASGTPPDHGGAINVVRDASGLRVEGVDLAPPSDALQFSVTRYQSAVDLSVLYAASRCANASPWTVAVEGVTGTFAAREALFLGASGSKRGRGDWAIRYAFAASPSVTGLTVGGIGGIAKAGMDYLWVEYDDEEGSGVSRLVKVPVAVHVERVWRTADFSALGIPAS